MKRSNLLDAQKAECKAAEVVRDQGLTALPICPFAIAAAHDIHVASKDSDVPGVSGFLMRVGDRFGICHASHIKNDGFIRFSVAHELGHYFLDGHVEAIFTNGQSIHASRSGFISDDRYERQADQFAAALLMPETIFRTAVNDAGYGFPAIQTLRATCRTSITATANRFVQFTDDPVAVIVSSGNQIDYCFISEALRSVRGVRFIPKGTLLPAQCCTSKFNSDPSRIARGEEDAGWTSLDDWFDDAPQIEMKEDVVGLGSYGRTLTVLFTDEAIEEDGDD